MRGREPVAWVAPRWRLMHPFYSEGMRFLMGKVLNILSVSKSSKFLIYWQENMHNFILVDDLPFLICFFFFSPPLFFFLSSLSQWSRGWVRTWKQPQSMHKNYPSHCSFESLWTHLFCQCGVLYFEPPPHKTTHQPQKTPIISVPQLMSFYPLKKKKRQKKKHLKHFSDPLVHLRTPQPQIKHNKAYSTYYWTVNSLLWTYLNVLLCICVVHLMGLVLPLV